MRRPTLGEAANLAEIVAAVAVVISLVYVGRELQSNTAAVKAASMQAVFGASSETLLTFAADSDLARIRLMGNRDPSRLTETEAFRFGVFARQFWLMMQNVYFQNELGVMDARVWQSYRRIVCDVWALTGWRTTWPAHRPVLDRGFVALVEECPG